MPRFYTRKAGVKYGAFEEEAMQNAIDEVQNGRMKVSEAARVYELNRSTLIYRLKAGGTVLKPGGKPVLDANEEKLMVKFVLRMAEWGFPVGSLDLRMLVKGYLDKLGRTEIRFQRNLPSTEWVYSFLKRYKEELSQRLAANINRNRAIVGPTDLNAYFANLSVEVRDVPAENIFNYDETNHTDDPGKKRVLCKRGQKYVSRICNSSKTATSVMYCGSASGVLLHPYVVYKAEGMYESWTRGGPKGAPCCAGRCCRRGSCYNRTSSGWFDGPTFLDWFKVSFLPHCQLLNGPKILVGDNLSSHFSTEVLKLCEENDIRFICLPPNSTHLTQPLDVAFFAPLKKAWRDCLSAWKASKHRSHTITKEAFPALVKDCLESIGLQKIEIGRAHV